MIDKITPDMINAGFEFLGAFMVIHNCKTLYDDGCVAGVSPWAIAFFTLWSAWNLFYYDNLGESVSWYAAIGMAVCQFIYLVMLVYYIKKPRINLSN